jgi:hypothetical protein
MNRERGGAGGKMRKGLKAPSCDDNNKPAVYGQLVL